MKEWLNIRIIDIARMAGVSVGTVDRVLHNRGRVSEEKKTLVKKVLEEINYEPNMVARFLASKRTYTFAAITPAYADGEYWELVTEGVNKAAEELKKFNIRVQYFQFDQYDRESYNQAVKSLLKKTFDGVVIATLYDECAVSLSAELDKREVPYIYIDADIPQQNNLAYFGANALASGSISAKLLIKEIGEMSDIIVLKVKYKYKDVSTQMPTREIGFQQYLEENKFQGTVFYLELDPDNLSQSLAKLEDILRKSKGLVGGVVFNSRVFELLNILDKLDTTLRQKLRLVGHDAVERNIQALKDGKILYLLSQRPELQGYDAVKSLGNYLLFNQIPNKENYIPIDIMIKENVEFYNNYKL